jgi:hypothetical protein
MRLLILATALGAVAFSAAPASAQHWRGNNREVRQEQRECQRELRRAHSRREYQRELRECRREIAAARHGYNRDRWDNDRRGYGYRDGYRRDRRYWDGYRWRNR